jgi:FO synthase
MDYVNPEAPWPGMADLRDRTRSMGFELRPRLPVYPEYVLEPDGFIPAGLLPKVAALADAQGYVRGGIQRYAGIE